MSTLTDRIIAACAARGITIGVAESLTGGLLVASLIESPGASAVVRGGVVAYDTALKHTLLGVDAELLAARGPVDERVAEQMAKGVREAVAVESRPAALGVSTTGVAGPDPQGDSPVGLVYIAVAFGDAVRSRELHLQGDRAAIRGAAVSESLALIADVVGVGAE